MEAVLVQPMRERIDAIMNAVLEGPCTLKAAVLAQGLTLSQFNWYLQKDKEAAVAVARAMEFRADLLVDETISLADGAGDPAKVRNQIVVRQWAAERYNRKKYGERIDLNVTQTVDVSATLAEARARITRPVRDQLEHDSSQVVDVTAKSVSSVSSAPEPTRSEPPAPLVPDIFA
jgi:hypothetical protein